MKSVVLCGFRVAVNPVDEGGGRGALEALLCGRMEKNVGARGTAGRA